MMCYSRIPRRTLRLFIFLLVVVAAFTVSSEEIADQQCDASDATCVDTPADAKDASDPVCTNNDAKCNDWADQGECVANPAYMLKQCMKACGVCGSGTDQDEADDPLRNEEECTDNLYDCPQLAADTMFCSTEDGEHLLDDCRKSCGCCVTKTSDFGVEQEATEGDTDYAATKVIIRESIKYMREIRNSIETANIRMCENKHALCSFWAALGECKTNTSFMNSDCAVACHSCYLIDLKQRCPMDPDAKAALENPGDLNRLFVRATTEPEYVAKYNPKVYSRPKLETPFGSDTKEGPWVVTFENFLSDSEIERLLYFGNKTGYEPSSDVGKALPDGSHDNLFSASRTSENTWCGEDCKADPLVADVTNRIADVTSTHAHNSEDLQLLRYVPGQYYVQHHDYIEHQLERPCGVRILTFFLYLNDVCDEEGECGGGTSFPELDITIQPKKGSALLWPSVLDAEPNQKDPRTDHEALPVTKGIKYGANAWIHQGNFQKALLTNCH
mmetsp:Transcript_12480/g.26973  ORF Transcript_12480/g.26973 Transcript_12480/m.26973 type:complete len:501 (+) Transcript_12480:262-1764(+)|eukprot:CAMPEP_0178504884 /NCGR_PEP_ID=MMETSP0696-20121128/18828_1 /TAXON_ID=265572 /ORGANISM="Extubocellulus spinifer, Strain CCMP396" /LENGTH=500 /DNA_ID=CAMNT_0020134143 /DNA_START=203 /DNA_END=1705 /DNA_ORIENTATION=-